MNEVPKVALVTIAVTNSFPTNGLNVSHEGERIFLHGGLAEEIKLAMKGSEGTAQVEIEYDFNYSGKRHLSLYRALSVKILGISATRKAAPIEAVKVIAILPHQQRLRQAHDYLLGRVEDTMDGVIFTGPVATHVVMQLGRPGGYAMMVRLKPYRGTISRIVWEVSTMDQITQEFGRAHVSAERKRGAGKLLELSRQLFRAPIGRPFLLHCNLSIKFARILVWKIQKVKHKPGKTS